MTVDELIDLTDALLEEAGFDLATLRGGNSALDGLNDQQFLLAVRFASGERPVAPVTGGRIMEDELLRSAPRPPRKLIPLDEDEAVRRLQELEELDEETPVGPIDLGDGVTLGL